VPPARANAIGSELKDDHVMIERRTLFAGLPALLPGYPAHRASAAQSKVLRVATQKGAAILMAERQQHGLENLLNPLGIEVQWSEFQFGPPIMEAMRAGSVDIGLVGDTPPIFAQAANSDLVYVAAIPASAEAILLPAGSDLKILRDLQGKRIGFARGSAAHNFAIAALETSGLKPEDVTLIALAPADAAAAFERGAIDAWAIWDPYFALYENRPGVRVLATSTGITPQNSFLIATRSFVTANPDITAKLVAELSRIISWASANREDMARLVSAGTGVPYEPTLRTMQRYPFRIEPITDGHIKSQQATADRFLRLGIIPSKIDVASQIWKPTT
jgi:sulfonate transport system substrate-binding protein